MDLTWLHYTIVDIRDYVLPLQGVDKSVRSGWPSATTLTSQFASNQEQQQDEPQPATEPERVEPSHVQHAQLPELRSCSVRRVHGRS